MKSIICIAHDIRSTHNVGSLLRTCEGLGIETLYFTGYTPYPATADDTRLPHESAKLSRQITKTALGAEITQDWRHHENIIELIESLRADNYLIAALEQTTDSIRLPDFHTNHKIALLLGREVEGIDAPLLSLCDTKLEIPMYGNKESFNVVQAAAMALYHCRFIA